MGEFQRRIDEEFAKVKLTWQQKKHQEGEEWAVKGVEMDGKLLVETAMNIVSGAKKEFPLNPIIEAINLYKKLKNHTEEEKQIIVKEHLKNCNLEQFVLEGIEWFVRWFCNGEK